MSASRSPLDLRWLCDMLERYLREGSIPPELRSAEQHRLVELILEVLGRSEAVRRQLAEQKDQFSRQAQREKSYFRFALTGILETARDGVVLTANQAAASILGVTPKSLARRALADVLSLNAHNRSRFERHMAFLGEQGISRTEIEIAATGAEPAVLEWASVDLGEGAVLHTFDDITEHKQAMEATERAKRAAEDAAAAKSQFAANVSHEIRTPLNAIIGLAELALRSRPPAPCDAHLAHIKDAADVLLALLNQVLDFSRAEAGRIDIERVPFPLDTLVSRVRAVIGPAAEAKALTLRIEISPLLPARLIGDPTRTTQVLLNLLGNAVKFTAQGMVSLHIQPDAHEAGRLRFTVSDTGAGIAPEEVARLFQPFTQADASVTRLHGGTGLGLAISKRLVEAMGGTIALESEVGRGTVVTVELPLPAAAEDATVTSGAVGTARETVSFAGRRVLLAEDTKLNREWLASLLRSAGIEVIEARDGREAVAAAFASPPPELILMDVQMPQLDGVGATREMRAHGCSVPVIALTANVTPEDKARCLAAGMNDFLPKPFAIDALWALLGQWLPAAAPAPAIDPQAVADRFLNDAALHRRFVGKFLAAHRDAAQRVRAHRAAGKRAEAAIVAHSVRGAAGLIGATDVQVAAGALEDALASTPGDDPGAHCERLENHLAALEAWLGADGPSPTLP